MNVIVVMVVTANESFIRDDYSVYTPQLLSLL